MCGIVGIVSSKSCVKDVIKGLKSLEYRGYDSAGIAILNQNKIIEKKSIGRIIDLEKKINKSKYEGNIVIGHTRWATHGKPSIKNCHPFVKSNCALVHNGIIENYEEIKKQLKLSNKNIDSDTDTEVIAEAFNKFIQRDNNIIKNIINISKKIKGTYSLAFLVKEKNAIYGTRKGSPLVLGIGDKFNSISSDVLGLPDNTKEIIFLDENDIFEISSNNFSIFNSKGKKVTRPSHSYISKKEFNTKGEFAHFMQKEIFHQPVSIEDTILNFADKNTNSIFLPKNEIDFNKISHIILVACGTAYHSCMVAKYWIEEITNLPVTIDIGSEFRYRENFIDKNSLGLVISQSGETMDTLESLKKLKKHNIVTVSIVNVINSSIARLSDYIFPTLAGPEIGVASTKAFTAQLAVLLLLALHINNQKKSLRKNKYKNDFKSIFNIHKQIKSILLNTQNIKKISESLIKSKSIFFIGRGIMYPLALEGALKLKEITYKHCEGYAAGELKHGPLALIEKNIPVIALAPFDKNFDKIMSNIQEVKARGGHIILITDSLGVKKAKKHCDQIILMPKTNFLSSSIIYSLPIQLISYYLAVKLKRDVDKPRNLAKSVTVE
jgi:glucosamine--fructose-6-phosphate aminotransferase (isomerizing)